MLLRDIALFPTKWPLARVVAVHSGKGNLIRVVTLRTEKGESKDRLQRLWSFSQMKNNYSPFLRLFCLGWQNVNRLNLITILLNHLYIANLAL